MDDEPQARSDDDRASAFAPELRSRTERASDTRDGVSRESSVRRVEFGADDARWCARGAGDDVVGVGEDGIGNSPRRGRGTRDVDGSLGAHDAAR